MNYSDLTPQFNEGTMNMAIQIWALWWPITLHSHDCPTRDYSKEGLG